MSTMGKPAYVYYILNMSMATFSLTSTYVYFERELAVDRLEPL
jgi:hypothetical protein